MSSRPDTYRILIAGNEELGFSLCAKLLDRTLSNPRTIARESLEQPWPQDEWTKHVTVSKDGAITTLELDLELHGPWVWELYNALEPRDYFRRFAGLVYCADPERENLPSELSNFIDSIEIHVGRRLPAIMIVDKGRKWQKGQMDALREIAGKNLLPIFFIRLDTGENIQETFKALANDIIQEDDV
ncbi:hypothetical protein EU527_14765 [Candidatus Thorarchaeota archaeon]|nr:MAG: hypothetical protein EU527_14765 [Candidatus Thorarchaeota archaeon]